MKELEDRQVVQAIVERNADGLAGLYDRYSGLLTALTRRILHNQSDTEEILQETFLQVWNQAERYDPTRSSVSTWLVLIARSRAIDRLRSGKVVDRTISAAQKEQGPAHASSKGVSAVLTHERRERLRQEMDTLPVEQREVLELAFYQGLTQSEIATRTNTPLGTVKTRTLLAMKKLRIALESEIKELL